MNGDTDPKNNQQQTEYRNLSEPRPANSLTERIRASLGRDYFLIGKTQIKGYLAWLLVGAAIGILSVVVFVANRSGKFGVWETGRELPRLNIQTQSQTQNPFLNSGSPMTASESCDEKPDGMSRDVCWQAKAVSERDATFCKSIQESNPFVSKDACFNLVAHEKKDLSLCASITNPELKKNCKETVK